MHNSCATRESNRNYDHPRSRIFPSDSKTASHGASNLRGLGQCVAQQPCCLSAGVWWWRRIALLNLFAHPSWLGRPKSALRLKISEMIFSLSFWKPPDVLRTKLNNIIYRGQPMARKNILVLIQTGRIQPFLYFWWNILCHASNLGMREDKTKKHPLPLESSPHSS